MAPALLSATICFQTGFLVQWKTASIYKLRVVWLFVGKLKWLSVNELTDCFSKAYKSVFQKSSSASVAARSNGEMRGGVATSDLTQVAALNVNCSLYVTVSAPVRFQWDSEKSSEMDHDCRTKADPFPRCQHPVSLICWVTIVETIVQALATSEIEIPFHLCLICIFPSTVH